MAKQAPKTQKSGSTRQADKRLLERFVPTKPVDDQFGRPNVVDLDVLIELKTYFLIGCTNKEAAHSAGISEQTYYNFVNGLAPDLKEDFLGLVEGWKDDMIVKSRKTIADSAATSPDIAKFVLERRRKDEFAPRTQHEIKEVTDFDNLSDEELEKIANASNKAQTPKKAAKPKAKPKKRKPASKK